jgi:hypothetical protein
MPGFKWLTLHALHCRPLRYPVEMTEQEVPG